MVFSDNFGTYFRTSKPLVLRVQIIEDDGIQIEFNLCRTTTTTTAAAVQIWKGRKNMKTKEWKQKFEKEWFEATCVFLMYF